VDAGVEGGSKRKIEEEWSLWDYGEQADFWTERPPLSVSVMIVGAALGVKWDALREKLHEGVQGAEPMELPPDAGPSIAELAKNITPPRHMGSTLAASAEVLRRLVPQKV
jgi:hypothetical protein